MPDSCLRYAVLLIEYLKSLMLSIYGCFKSRVFEIVRCRIWHESRCLLISECAVEIANAASCASTCWIDVCVPGSTVHQPSALAVMFSRYTDWCSRINWIYMFHCWKFCRFYLPNFMNIGSVKSQSYRLQKGGRCCSHPVVIIISFNPLMPTVAIWVQL